MKITKVWVDDVLLGRNQKKSSNENLNQKDLTHIQKKKAIENIETKEFLNKIQTFLSDFKPNKLHHNLDSSRVKAVMEGQKTGLLDNLRLKIQKEVVGEENQSGLLSESALLKFNKMREKF